MTKRSPAVMNRVLPVCAFLCLMVTLLPAQVPVAFSPMPIQQFFDANGNPLAFGCVFSYQSGTTTPLATYTDATGTVTNSDPVILASSGVAGDGTSSGIWLQAGVAYTLKVKSAGGTNCASGSTIKTVDGIGGGLTLLTTNVTCNTTCSFPIASQIQLFKVNLTGNAVANPLTAVGIVPPAIVIFEITQDIAGGHSFTWPANSIGGAPIGLTANQTTEQMFVWDGTNAITIGPGITGAGPAMSADTLRLTGQLTSVLATGTAPFVIASTTQVANLNVSFLEGFTWEVPGTIGSTTPNSGVFTHLTANTDFVLNGSQPQTGVSGGASDVKLVSTPGLTAGAGAQICEDAGHGVTDVCTTTGPIFAPQRVDAIGDTTVNINTQTTVLTKSVTFPAAPGTYRADVRYGAWGTIANNACAAVVVDVTNNKAYALHGQDANGAGFIALSGSEITAQTYAASAVVTFHLDVICNATETITKDSGLFTISPNESTYMQITPVRSN